MSNEYVNKVVINNQIKLDLTADTITDSDLKSGVTAHDKSGAAITGTLDVPTVQDSKNYSVLANGSFTIEPDSGYDGMEQVNLTVSVPTVVEPYTVTINHVTYYSASDNTRTTATYTWLEKVDNTYDLVLRVSRTAVGTAYNFVVAYSIGGGATQYVQHDENWNFVISNVTANIVITVTAVLKGDIRLRGSITTLSLTQVRKYFNGLRECNAFEFAASDINMSNSVCGTDIALLKQGLIESAFFSQNIIENSSDDICTLTFLDVSEASAAYVDIPISVSGLFNGGTLVIVTNLGSVAISIATGYTSYYDLTHSSGNNYFAFSRISLGVVENFVIRIKRSDSANIPVGQYYFAAYIKPNTNMSLITSENGQTVITNKPNVTITPCTITIT